MICTRQSFITNTLSINSSPLCFWLDWFFFQLFQQTRRQRLQRKALISAYQSRSRVWFGSRPSLQDWAWLRGWCWWASVVGSTVDITGGSSWDIIPHPLHTHQQVSRERLWRLSYLGFWHHGRYSKYFKENIITWRWLSGNSHFQDLCGFYIRQNAP